MNKQLENLIKNVNFNSCVVIALIKKFPELKKEAMKEFKQFSKIVKKRMKEEQQKNLTIQ